MPRHALCLAVILAVVLGLSGCGRKGDLEPPPGQALVDRNGKKVDPGIAKPKQSFVLDPLLN